MQNILKFAVSRNPVNRLGFIIFNLSMFFSLPLNDPFGAL